jgi:nucleotide-binding universal stress UspA family protein
MKILLALDGSDCSKAAAEEVARRPWPAGSKIRIITVIEPLQIPMTPGLDIDDYRADLTRALEGAARANAQALIDGAVGTLQAGGHEGVTITAKILKGSAKRLILDEAEKWEATLIVVGAHDYRDAELVLFGSVSQTVAVNARCSVEIVRRQQTRGRKGGRK